MAPDTGLAPRSDDLPALLEAAAAIPGIPPGPLAELRDKLAQRAFELVVASEFKLPKADAEILVASVNQPMSRTELDFLAEIRRYAGKVFCLLNTIDLLSESELVESVAFASDVLREALGGTARLFPVSARLARQGALAASRLPDFDAALGRFLQEERGAVWADSRQRNLTHLLTEARLGLELEWKALTEPLVTPHQVALGKGRNDRLMPARDLA